MPSDGKDGSHQIVGAEQESPSDPNRAPDIREAALPNVIFYDIDRYDARCDDSDWRRRGRRTVSFMSLITHPSATDTPNLSGCFACS